MNQLGSHWEYKTPLTIVGFTRLIQTDL